MDVSQLASALGLVAASTDRLVATLACRLDIGVSDLRALHLVHTGSQVSAKDIGSALAITSGSTTPLVDRLTQRGLLRRTDHPTDRRSTLLELTPAGQQAVAWAGEHLERAVALALGGYDGDLDQLHDLLLSAHTVLERTAADL